MTFTQYTTVSKRICSKTGIYFKRFKFILQVTPCHDDASNIPSISFNFVPISQLTKMEKDSIIGKRSLNLIRKLDFISPENIDVIGVAKSASDVTTIVSKTTNKELRKREVHLVDATNTEVTLFEPPILLKAITI